MPTGTRKRSPRRATRPPASVRAAPSETCWPRTARTASSAASTQPGSRSPGARSTSGPISSIAAERRAHRHRVGVQVEQARAALARLRQVGGVLEQVANRDFSLGRVEVELDHTRSPREPQAAPVGGAADLLDAGHGPRDQVGEQADAVERRTGYEALGDHQHAVATPEAAVCVSRAVTSSVVRPSGWTVQPGLWATSQGWPSGSTKTAGVPAPEGLGAGAPDPAPRRRPPARGPRRPRRRG